MASDGRYPIHTFTRLATTRLTFSCGTKQSAKEFAAQKGLQQGFLAVMFEPSYILLMHEPLGLFFVKTMTTEGTSSNWRS